MKFDQRWMDWERSQKKVANYAKDSPTENTKIMFEGFVGDHSPKTPTIFPVEAEPAAHKEAARRWLAEHCSFRERLWWGVTVLHRTYCAWCDEEGQEVRAGLETFRGWLQEKGFTITKDDLVYGLVPTKDFLSLDKNPKVSYVQG